MWLVLLLVLLLLFLLVPLVYGWGYKGWGPPSASAYRRRRSGQALDAEAEDSWGIGALLLWIGGIFFVVVLVIVAIVAFV